MIHFSYSPTHTQTHERLLFVCSWVSTQMVIWCHLHRFRLWKLTTFQWLSPCISSLSLSERMIPKDCYTRRFQLFRLVCCPPSHDWHHRFHRSVYLLCCICFPSARPVSQYVDDKASIPTPAPTDLAPSSSEMHTASMKAIRICTLVSKLQFHAFNQ